MTGRRWTPEVRAALRRAREYKLPACPGCGHARHDRPCSGSGMCTGFGAKGCACTVRLAPWGDVVSTWVIDTETGQVTRKEEP